MSLVLAEQDDPKSAQIAHQFWAHPLCKVVAPAISEDVHIVTMFLANAYIESTELSSADVSYAACSLL